MSRGSNSQPTIAPADRCARCISAAVLVIVPCYNEERTVGDVVRGFFAQLPGVSVLVADNASSDQTARVAREAGASVIAVPAKGKGRAVRALLENSDHD
ncbi:MAG: glycosyltransferase, partial [Micrococcales bacterium]|nr:glycosyltransferase [Micrococcales bacterium]